MGSRGCGALRRLLAGAAVLIAATPVQAAPKSHSTTSGQSGGQIAFASTRDGDGDAEIFVMDADGSNLRQVTHNDGDDHSPDWAPDGRRIVFVHEPPDQTNADLHIVDIVTGEERAFTSWRYWYETDPAWSPDGKWIAFASEHPDADGGDVIALSVDGERSRAIATQQENSTNVDPAWSPDGKRLVFIEYYDSYDLYTTSFCCSHGYKRRTVTHDGFQEWHPEWSPDGSKILFSRSTALFKHGLYTIAPDGKDLRVVFEGPLDARSGSWSPDGRAIVFYAQGGLGYDVYRINADGTGLVRLTDETGSDQHPDWSPVAPG
jgi:TolB protein